MTYQEKHDTARRAADHWIAHVREMKWERTPQEIRYEWDCVYWTTMGGYGIRPYVIGASRM